MNSIHSHDQMLIRLDDRELSISSDDFCAPCIEPIAAIIIIANICICLPFHKCIHVPISNALCAVYCIYMEILVHCPMHAIRNLQFDLQ